MTEGAITPPGQVDSALVDLHAARTVEQLDEGLLRHLRSLLSGTDAALLLLEGDPYHATVRLAVDPDGPWRPGQRHKFKKDGVNERVVLALIYGDRELGYLMVAARPDPERDAQLRTLLDHYVVALVNLTLEAEARVTTDSYCASLQALEEGIVLFQETDPEAVTARLMGLATTMLQATAGALYVLEEVGNADSGLKLTQTLGIPEQLLDTFRGNESADWPRCLLDREPFFVLREEDPTLGGLEPESLPDVLADLACLPLRYHGVTAGVCLLFNTTHESVDASEKLHRMNKLGELAAALLHRLSLEDMRVRTREIETQLEIAEIIQRRLLPDRAPDCPNLDFAWRSLAARKIGGDYLDLLTDEKGRVHALIGDAAGHGVDSALLMTAFRSTYRAEAPRSDPGALLAQLNEEVHKDVGTTGMFLTAAAMRIDPNTLKGDFSSAGHNPVILYRAADGEFEELESEGPPLGFMPNADFGERSFTLKSGDLLILYTDGIPEATKKNGEMFGDDRLRSSVRARASLGAQAVLEGILADLEAFTGRDSYDDDVSLTVIRAR